MKMEMVEKFINLAKNEDSGTLLVLVTEGGIVSGRPILPDSVLENGIAFETRKMLNSYEKHGILLIPVNTEDCPKQLTVDVHFVPYEAIISVGLSKRS